MKKMIKYAIPVLVLLVFVAVMTSGGLVKRPLGKEDDVVAHIEAVKRDVVSENWQQAQVDLSKVKSAWTTVAKRVQFSVERNEMNTIDMNIARMEGAISAQDKSAALMELSEMMEHWDDLEK